LIDTDMGVLKRRWAWGWKFHNANRDIDALKGQGVGSRKGVRLYLGKGLLDKEIDFFHLEVACYDVSVTLN